MSGIADTVMHVGASSKHLSGKGEGREIDGGWRVDGERDRGVV